MFRILLVSVALLGLFTAEAQPYGGQAAARVNVRGRAFVGGHRAVNAARFVQHRNNVAFVNNHHHNANFRFNRGFYNVGYASAFRFGGFGYQAPVGVAGAYGDCGGGTAAASYSYGATGGCNAGTGFRVASAGGTLLSEEVTEQHTDGTVVKTFRQFSR